MPGESNGDGVFEVFDPVVRSRVVHELRCDLAKLISEFKADGSVFVHRFAMTGDGILVNRFELERIWTCPVNVSGFLDIGHHEFPID